MHKTYGGVYDPRILGVHNGNHIYYDEGDGIVIERKYWKKPTKDELKKIREKFGDLENKIICGKNSKKKKYG